jgi:hypothetical protein
MKESIRHKLESVRDRFEELAGLLADPEVISDQNKFRDLSKEYSRVEPVVKLFSDYESIDADMAAAREMAGDSDAEVRAMGEEELAALEVGQGEPEAAELVGEIMGSRDVAVRHEQAPDVLALQVLGDEFDRDPGTDEQGRVLPEVGKELLRKGYRRVGDRYRAGADFRVGSYLLGDRKRVLEQSRELLADGSCALGVPEGVL